MAETLPTVIGAEKKISPLTAIGSLFKAPTIEYVVDDVTLMHQAEQYEMNIPANPEYNMPTRMPLRDSGGKFLAKLAADQSSTRMEQTTRTGTVSRLL